MSTTNEQPLSVPRRDEDIARFRNERARWDAIDAAGWKVGVLPLEMERSGWTGLVLTSPDQQQRSTILIRMCPDFRTQLLEAVEKCVHPTPGLTNLAA